MVNKRFNECEIRSVSLSTYDENAFRSAVIFELRLELRLSFSFVFWNLFSTQLGAALEQRDDGDRELEPVLQCNSACVFKSC